MKKMRDCGKCKHLYEKFPQYDGDIEYGCDLLSKGHIVHIGMEMVFCPKRERGEIDGGE